MERIEKIMEDYEDLCLEMDLYKYLSSSFYTVTHQDTKIKYALVKFDNAGKQYCFKTILSLNMGDGVICDTSVGLCDGVFLTYTSDERFIDNSNRWILKSKKI
jgi:hypothetical protein